MHGVSARATTYSGRVHQSGMEMLLLRGSCVCTYLGRHDYHYLEEISTPIESRKSTRPLAPCHVLSPAVVARVCP